MPNVFISYRQNDDNQRSRVREFGERLRSCEIDVVLDQFFLDINPAGPNEGWDKWSSDRALQTEYVLIVGTQAWFQCFEKTHAPGCGLGAACEADDLRHRIYEAGGVIEGIRVVLFDDTEAAHIPAKLKRYHRFHADRDFTNIVRWLGGNHCDLDVRGQKARLTGAFAEQVAKESRAPRSEDMFKYREANKATYERLIAGRRLVSIAARTRSSAIVDARASIEKWVRTHAVSDLVVLGDPGSGKTVLLRGLCASLSESEEFVPVFIAAGQLQHLRPAKWQELLAFADPQVPSAISEIPNLVIVLDGLDELVGPSRDDQANYAETLESIGMAIPVEARLVYSCRSTTFEATSKSVTDALRSRMRIAARGCDSTDDAIRVALQSRIDPGIESLEIVELSKERARQYVVEAAGDECADNPAIEYVLSNLPRVPMILRFLQLALPELRDACGRTDLDELYAAAMRTWILRDPAFGAEGLDRVWESIKRLASALSRRAGDTDSDRLVHSGLLAKTSWGSYSWAHSSIGEFFYSLSLFDELSAFDSSKLSRLDMISGYNINRFLVPRCRRALKVFGEPVTMQPVTCGQYVAFLKATGWRSITGYGLHPSYIAEDGTGFTSGTEDLVPERRAEPDIRNELGFVSGLSWYDAFAYCLWSGQRLPKADEVKAGHSLLRDYWVWSSDWNDEPKAHIAVVTADRMGSVCRGGVNPDFRHSRIGLVSVKSESR